MTPDLTDPVACGWCGEDFPAATVEAHAETCSPDLIIPTGGEEGDPA
jgi:hypothetical protein